MGKKLCGVKFNIFLKKIINSSLMVSELNIEACNDGHHTEIKSKLAIRP